MNQAPSCPSTATNGSQNKLQQYIPQYFEEDEAYDSDFDYYYSDDENDHQDEDDNELEALTQSTTRLSSSPTSINMVTGSTKSAADAGERLPLLANGENSKSSPTKGSGGTATSKTVLGSSEDAGVMLEAPVG